MIRARFYRAMARCRRGVTAIEFAILAPVMFLLIMAGVEFGHVMLVRMTLEGSLSEGARAAMADLTTTDEARFIKLDDYVTHRMAAYIPVAGGDLDIKTTVFGSFAASMPEPYEDTNHNKIYDGPGPGTPGEWFDDRNHNGVRDLIQPKSGMLGGPGDVVSYNATFKTPLYFSILNDMFNAQSGYPVNASVVLRNEPVARAVLPQSAS